MNKFKFSKLFFLSALISVNFILLMALSKEIYNPTLPALFYIYWTLLVLSLLASLSYINDQLK